MYNMTNEELLQELAETYGFDDPLDMLEEFVTDSVVPGICTKCEEYTTGVEPDSRSGWCEECEARTVESCLVLAGII